MASSAQDEMACQQNTSAEAGEIAQPCTQHFCVHSKEPDDMESRVPACVQLSGQAHRVSLYRNRGCNRFARENKMDDKRQN